MSVYTHKILMKLVNFRRLKSAVGHDYVNENEVYNLHLKIKFTFRKDLNWQQMLLVTTGCVQRYKN